jgi:integrase
MGLVLDSARFLASRSSACGASEIGLLVYIRLVLVIVYDQTALAASLEIIVSLSKQAKTLTRGQIDAVLGYLERTRNPVRNRAIFLLSVRAGLRAKEIASLTWDMVTESDDAIGKAIRLEDIASKGKSGRVIPLSRDLREALSSLRQIPSRGSGSRFLIKTERSTNPSPQVIVNLFCQWYQALGFNGCSSHSGRRTFITNAARKISTVGGSLRDVQVLAGHSNLATTQRYIESDGDAQRKIVELV